MLVIWLHGTIEVIKVIECEDGEWKEVVATMKSAPHFHENLDQVLLFEHGVRPFEYFMADMEER